jgi:hypothetical protein
MKMLNPGYGLDLQFLGENKGNGVQPVLSIFNSPSAIEYEISIDPFYDHRDRNDGGDGVGLPVGICHVLRCSRL